MGIASQYTPQLRNMLLDIQKQEDDIHTITALSLAVFRLFVDKDTKSMISEEDIIKSVKSAILQTREDF